jgi:spore coat protein U-like protein
MLGAEQMKTLLRNAVRGLAGATLMICASVAIAQSPATTTFQVQAAVVANCLVSANNLAFGTYDPTAADLDVDTQVLVRCTNGTGYTVALNAGVTPGATLAQRRMTNGTDFMNYNLYTAADHLTIFGDGTGGTATVGGTGTGLGVAQQQTVTVFGRIPTGQTTLPIATYTETTITVTVTF